MSIAPPSALRELGFETSLLSAKEITLISWATIRYSATLARTVMREEGDREESTRDGTSNQTEHTGTVEDAILDQVSTPQRSR
jgi:hypothetical protein